MGLTRPRRLGKPEILPPNGEQKRDLAQTHASGRWLGSLPQGSPKGDMSGSEGGNARREKRNRRADVGERNVAEF